MTEIATKCAACGASFGIKFKVYTCIICGEGFCGGDVIPSHHTRIHSDLRAPFSGERRGTCIECILEFWGKSDDDLAPPKGVVGRVGRQARNAWQWVKENRPGQRSPMDLLAVQESAFAELNWEKALAIARHQREMSSEDIARSLVLFARLYAVSQGRDSERSVSLRDTYALIDWVRTHPRIPELAHRVHWSTIESTPAYLNYLSDAWHIAQAAIALTNPATGAAAAIYHLGDRAVDQVADKGLFRGFYDMVKDKLNINVNPKDALLSYLAGLIILQLLRRQE